jgi:hypothetical protein
MSQGELDMPLTLTRSFFAIILPGVIVAAPWILYGLQEVAGLADLYKTYAAPANICAFALVVLVGAMIEAVGTYIEKLWDIAAGRAICPDSAETWLEKDWYDYLSRQFGDNEPVAYRYLSRKVTELYFELGMMWAGPVGLLGMIMVMRPHISSIFLCLSIALISIVALLFYKFARDTHEVLYDTRWRINRRLADK